MSVQQWMQTKGSKNSGYQKSTPVETPFGTPMDINTNVIQTHASDKKKPAPVFTTAPVQQLTSYGSTKPAPAPAAPPKWMSTSIASAPAPAPASTPAKGSFGQLPKPKQITLAQQFGVETSFGIPMQVNASGKKGASMAGKKKGGGKSHKSRKSKNKHQTRRH